MNSRGALKDCQGLVRSDRFLTINACELHFVETNDQMLTFSWQLQSIK